MGRAIKAVKTRARVTLKLKVCADTKTKIEQAAKASGRSQSQEAEYRIQQSFYEDRILSAFVRLAGRKHD